MSFLVPFAVGGGTVLIIIVTYFLTQVPNAKPADNFWRAWVFILCGVIPLTMAFGDLFTGQWLELAGLICGAIVGIVLIVAAATISSFITTNRRLRRQRLAHHPAP